MRCKQLKKWGYTIALDDFFLSGTHFHDKLLDELLYCIDILKIDFLKTTCEERRDIYIHIKSIDFDSLLKR